MSDVSCPFILHGDPLQHVLDYLDVRSLCTALQVGNCADLCYPTVACTRKPRSCSDRQCSLDLCFGDATCIAGVQRMVDGRFETGAY